MNKLFKTFRKSGNKVVEINRVAIKQPHKLADGSINPEFVIDNLRSPDYGKKIKDTANYGLKKTLPKRSEPMFEAPKETPKNDRFTFTQHTDMPQSIPNPTIRYRPEPTKLQMSDFLYEVASPTDGRNMSKVQPVYLVKQGYYLLYEANMCYILSDKVTAQKRRNDNVLVSYPNILIKFTAPDCNGAKVSHSGIIHQNPKPSEYRHLTKAEFDNIVKTKPEFEDLFAFYTQLVNNDGVEMNVNAAVPVF